ncbi:MAG: hypothetical protein IMZ52_04720 [Actinobacteria bacterium]|nr:hypothetical protein [Actinomycetota bacterium]MBE3114768.1 hypothetical protein [Actinomycetota bacterium]
MTIYSKDDIIFKGKREIHISKSKEYHSNSMYVLWQRDIENKDIIGNIIITPSLIKLAIDRFERGLLKKGSITPDFDKILIETVIDTLNHELMHLAIYDIEGMNTSRLYDLFIGGTIHNNRGVVSSGGSSIQYRREIGYREYLP